MYKHVFIADIFSDQYAGGAELTTDAIIEKRNDILKINSNNLTNNFIIENKDKIWIFGNFSNVDPKMLMNIIKAKINYHILEYDFKMCFYRSVQKHEEISGACDCIEKPYGKLISLFFSHANQIWFMSEKQSNDYKNSMPFLKKENIKILSSVFDLKHLENMVSLNKEIKKENNKYIILNSSSWIKGVGDCIEYANRNNLEYELVWGLKYGDMLKKIRKSKGLIFLPKAPDTCPRIVIEAKILECDLHLNENVYHKDENWFQDGKIIEYLKNRVDYFWSEVKNNE
jgi:hypothetical protein